MKPPALHWLSRESVSPSRPPIAPQSLSLAWVCYGLASCPAIAGLLHCIFN